MFLTIVIRVWCHGSTTSLTYLINDLSRVTMKLFDWTDWTESLLVIRYSRKTGNLLLCISHWIPQGFTVYITTTWTQNVLLWNLSIARFAIRTSKDHSCHLRLSGFHGLVINSLLNRDPNSRPPHIQLNYPFWTSFLSLLDEQKNLSIQ